VDAGNLCLRKAQPLKPCAPLLLGPRASHRTDIERRASESAGKGRVVELGIMSQDRDRGLRRQFDHPVRLIRPHLQQQVDVGKALSVSKRLAGVDDYRPVSDDSCKPGKGQTDVDSADNDHGRGGRHHVHERLQPFPEVNRRRAGQGSSGTDEALRQRRVRGSKRLPPPAERDLFPQELPGSPNDGHRNGLRVLPQPVPQEPEVRVI